MTLEEFADNNRGINNGHDLPPAMLAALYASVGAREILAHPEEQPEESGGGASGGGGGGGPAAAAAAAAQKQQYEAAAAAEPPSHARCAYLRLRRGLPS